MTVAAEEVWQDIQQIRSSAPLVHNITNYVVMNTTANALLAIGASPVMAHAREEVAQMAAIASALVINIGTLSGPWVQSMAVAMQVAGEKEIPIILDPVGVGATAYRTQTANQLLATAPPAVIRGNASEIIALVVSGAATKGVDATAAAESALTAGQKLHATTGSTVCISGETDYIIGGQAVVSIANGHPLMPRVTGLGCTATALCGAFAAVNPSSRQATAHAMATMGIAGEMAAERAPGPASFQTAFIDSLYQLKAEDVAARLNAGRV